LPKLRLCTAVLETLLAPEGCLARAKEARPDFQKFPNLDGINQPEIEHEMRQHPLCLHPGRFPTTPQPTVS
jgi:hypothetical protein